MKFRSVLIYWNRIIFNNYFMLQYSIVCTKIFVCRPLEVFLDHVRVCIFRIPLSCRSDGGPGEFRPVHLAGMPLAGQPAGPVAATKHSEQASGDHKRGRGAAVLPAAVPGRAGHSQRTQQKPNRSETVKPTYKSMPQCHWGCHIYDINVFYSTHPEQHFSVCIQSQNHPVRCTFYN